MNNEKKIIRKAILEKRNSLSETEQNIAAMLLTERILGHQWYYRSKVILGFASYGSEINITDILVKAIEDGKKVYLPKVEGEDMEFYRVLNLDCLEMGYKGILEPKGDTELFSYEDYMKRNSSGEGILMLMPGVAFDAYRNRIGYGKGFYDRFLLDKEILQLHTIGVGFQCQIVPQIPFDSFDIKPYQVICV